MGGQPETATSLDSWFARAPLLVGIVSASTFLTTIIYEWGYFGTLGPHFQTLLTPTDYLTNAILWLPGSLLVFSLASALTLLMFSPLRRLSGPDRSPVVRTWTNRFTAALAVVTMLGLLVVAFYEGVPILFLAIFFAPIGAFFSLRLSRHFGIRGEWTAAAFAFPFLMAWIGVNDAQRDLNAFAPVYRIVFTGSPPPRMVVMLRTFDRGIIVRVPENQRLEFIRWNEINSLSRIGIYTPPVHRLLCKLWLARCGPEPPVI